MHLTKRKNIGGRNMMHGVSKVDESHKPLAGWTCVAVGVGFLLLVTAGLVAVRFLAG